MQRHQFEVERLSSELKHALATIESRESEIEALHLSYTNQMTQKDSELRDLTLTLESTKAAGHGALHTLREAHQKDLNELESHKAKISGAHAMLGEELQQHQDLIAEAHRAMGSEVPRHSSRLPPWPSATSPFHLHHNDSLHQTPPSGTN